MHVMRASVLIVSIDPVLSATRVMLLDHYRAVTMAPLEAADGIHSEAPDLLIICQTVPDEEARYLIENARAVAPKIKILAVCNQGQRRDLDAVLHEIQIDHPEGFVSAVSNLLQVGESVSGSA